MENNLEIVGLSQDLPALTADSKAVNLSQLQNLTMFRDLYSRFARNLFLVDEFPPQGLTQPA